MSGPLRDAVVVGGGPAGLAFAIAAAERGLDVLVVERRAEPVDKACGEGLLPAGVRALERLGIAARFAPADAAPFDEIRWSDPGGRTARLRLPAPGGLGVRRTALVAALVSRARALGVEVRDGVEVTGHARGPDGVRVDTRQGPLEARVLVAADGLASPVRRREGLDVAPRARPRFGMRRHFAIRPWASAVEVHFGDGAEAYVTPVGERRVGIAFLFERDAGGSYEALLARFPSLAGRLAAAPPDSELRGAGPFARSARARVADRLVLLGDAAGYLDALSGEGLSLAFGCALDLAELLPAAVARGADRGALAPYERCWRRRFRPYAAYTRFFLAAARHPTLRGALLALAASRPAPFERAVAAAVG